MSQARILVVEDESIVSLEIQGRLEELGYYIAGAVYSGEDAVIKAGILSPDLILMDINLRGELDGIGAANIIKDKLRIPVIYMTAYADDETLQRAKVSEPYAYIIKPIEVRELHSSIEIALFKSKMEKQLRESEKRFRSIFENATIGIYRTSISFELIFANDALIKMFGFDSIAEMRKIDFSKIGYVNENRRSEFIAEVEKNGTITGFESAWRKKDGSIIYISESARKDVDENGNVFFEGTIEDITERKLTEINLIDSEEILSNIFDTTYNGILIHDLNGKILKVNQRFASFHGVSSEEILKLNLSDLVNSEENINKIKSHWPDVLAGKNSVVEIKTNSLRDKNLYDIEIYLSKLTIKNQEYILANLRNITEQKKSREALSKAKETLQKIFDNVYNAIFIHDHEGRIIDVNEKVLALYKIDRIQALTLTIHEISADGSSFEKAAEYWSNAVNGKNQIFEWKAKRPNDGHVFDVEVFLTKINISGKDYILANVRDITEQKKDKEALVYAKNIAEKSDRLKSEFLAGMSHEIRTPVNTILSYSGLLKDELKEMGLNHFGDIFHSISFGGKRLIRTVDSILNMSQIQTGTFDLMFGEVDIETDILIPLYSEFKVEAANKGLGFTIERAADNTIVNGDSYSLGQLFTNLIDNALKYTHAGFVKIKTYKNEKNKLNVDISDSGIGISEEFLKNIFNPFTQESHGYSRRFEGNGLGLALVKKYCDMNNSEISIKSKKGEGSTFTVTFK